MLRPGITTLAHSSRSLVPVVDSALCHSVSWQPAFFGCCHGRGMVLQRRARDTSLIPDALY